MEEKITRQELQKEVKEQEIEEMDVEIDSELKESPNQISKYISIPEELRKHPYKLIREHYESIYPCTGGRLWSILALSIVSLVMPRIPRGEKLIKNPIDISIFGTPGTGKSSNGDEFEKVSYFPLSTERITTARLYNEVMLRALVQKENTIPKLTLIITDMAIMLQDEKMIKMLENLLGEEGIISKATMQNRKDELKKRVDVVAYISGTPDLIYNRRIREGLIFRTLTLILIPTKKQHELILDYISDNMGNVYKNKDSENIKNFYEEIWDIQHNKHSKIKPVTGYDISDEIKEGVKNFIKPLVEKIFDRYSTPFARSTEETFRIMCASAMLNIFNRKITDGKIKIEWEDFELAKKIMTRDIAHKTRIMQSIEQIDYWGIRDIKDLRDWNDRMNRAGKVISEETEFIMRELVERKKKNRFK